MNRAVVLLKSQLGYITEGLDHTLGLISLAETDIERNKLELNKLLKYRAECEAALELIERDGGKL